MKKTLINEIIFYFQFIFVNVVKKIKNINY